MTGTGFLLDTSVFLEAMDPEPDAGVLQWLSEVDEDNTFISVITIADLRHDIEDVAPASRREALKSWLRRDLPQRFRRRVLPVNVPVAEAWGVIVARHDAICSPIETRDAFIAATAEAYKVSLVTKNPLAFRGVVTPIISPWTGQQLASRDARPGITRSGRYVKVLARSVRRAPE